MALDILHDNWGPYTHTEVENALKAYLSVLEDRINQAIQEGGVGLTDLSLEVQALLSKANTALQPDSLAAWAKAQNKPGYTADEITGITGFQNLLAKLQDMDQKIQAAAQSGGVDPDDEMSSTSEKPVQNKVIKAYVDAAVQAVQTALNNLMNGQNVTDAIDTFNEVINFLDDIDTDDPTLANQLLALNNAITALQGTLSQKANSSDVANTYATKSELTSGLSGKQNKLTFDDAPTAGSNNPVKSGGIKTAIDNVTPTIDANGKWVIGGVTTDKDAQGPRGNTVLVNENAQGIQALIVNNVSDGGETDILSAEMGKVLRQNIMKIFNALGVYAFPEGKPTLNWGSTAINHSINVNGVTGGLTISDVEVDGVSVGSLPAQVVEGKSLSLRLALPSNLYVFDDGVSVKMGGVDITSTAFSEATGEVNIAEVTDDVVIIATALTYVGYGESNSPLAFMLDCKNRGNQSGHWIDLAGNIDFTLGSAVTAADSGVVFDGSANSYGETNSSLNIAPSAATIEAVVHWDSEEYAPILSNPVASGAKLNTGLVLQRSVNKAIMAVGYNNGQVSDMIANDCVSIGNANDFALSFNNQRYINKGVATSPNEKSLFIMNAAHTKLTIGRSRRPIDDSRGDVVFIGTIKAIRVYNAVLTEAQQMQNWKVDQKRFNIS